MKKDPARPDDRRVEPIMAALHEGGKARERSWGWKIVWIAIAVAGLTWLVVKQAF